MAEYGEGEEGGLEKRGEAGTGLAGRRLACSSVETVQLRP